MSSFVSSEISSSSSSSNSGSSSSSSNSSSSIKRISQGRNIWDDPIIEKSQDQDQGQGQGQEHLLLQRAALPHFLVLAVTLTLVLVLRFFNYRVVPDIPSLITSLEKWSRNGFLQSNKKRIDDMNLHKKTRRIQLE